MTETAKYDLIVYGASGFTGKQAAAYIAENAPATVHWAIAGRNRDKLEAVKSQLDIDVDVLVADSLDVEAINSLVASTRVILTTVGPYALYGEPLIRACADLGVDYVDITGETPFIRLMIDACEANAISTGAKIVPFCGFDSIPSDIGALLLVDYFKTQGKGTKQVKAFHKGKGGFNGGTAASMLHMMRNPEIQSELADPMLLNPNHMRFAEEALENMDPTLPTNDPDLGHWVAPFIMGPINTRVVRRSNALEGERQAGYGNDFKYQEYMNLGKSASLFASTAVSAMAGTMNILGRIPGAPNLLEKIVPKPGEGPSEEAMDNGFFECLLVGTAEDGSKAWANISGEGDPGNRATLTFLCESALCLVCDRDTLPGGKSRAGFLTPATAFGQVLVERLRKTGMKLDCPVEHPSQD